MMVLAQKYLLESIFHELFRIAEDYFEEIIHDAYFGA